MGLLPLHLIFPSISLSTPFKFWLIFHTPRLVTEETSLNRLSAVSRHVNHGVDAGAELGPVAFAVILHRI